MSTGAVLVADPIANDVSVIADTLAAHGLSTITPPPSVRWQDIADKADALIVNLVPVDAAAFARLIRCRVVTRLGVGFDNIDTNAARARGIVVTNVPDYCREEVSDHALALILTLLRRIAVANSDVQRGIWNQLGYGPIHRLSMLTLGLIGFGRLAQALGRKAAALGMRVIAYDPNVSREPACSAVLLSLDALLGQADVISLHVPLLAETRGMIRRDAFRKMKKGVIMVNTSRGELIDELALIDALDEEHLSGAALDVLSSEPPPAQSRLLGRPNVLLTPHMAFYSEESLVQLQRTAAEDVVRALSGQTPRYRVA